MSVLVARVGRSGAGGANSDYITRLSAAEKIAFYNLEHLESEQIAEARTNAIAYAHAREEIELAKGQPRQVTNAPMPESNQKTAEDLKSAASSIQPPSLAGSADSAARKFSEEMKAVTEISEVSTADEESLETIKNASKKPKKERQVRTHYRLIASWEGKETSENAVAAIKVYLEKQFPKARAIIAIHQDTDDTHAHVWIDARQTDGKKIHLKDKQFETLDEKWTEQYDRTYGTKYAPEYKALKQETKEWKREMYEWHQSQAESQTKSAGNVENAEISESAKNAEKMENTAGVRLLAPPPPKPQRAADRFKTDYWKEKEVQQITGAAAYEKINAGTSYSDAQRGDRFTQAAERFAKTDDKFARRAELSAQETKQDDRAKQSKNDGDERFGNRTKPPAAGAAQDGSAFVQSDDEYYQSSESGRTGFAENETKHLFDIDQSDVYFQRAGEFAEKLTKSQISQEQLYEDKSGLGSTNGSHSGRSNEKDFIGNSTIGKFNLELGNMPEIQFEVPQLAMDAQTMIKDTMQMIQTSLERRRIEMNEGAVDLYRQHLNYTAELAPSPTLLTKIDEFNSSAAEDNFIEIKHKSWLEANHEYLSSLSAQKLDREAVNIAGEFEENLIEEQKQDPNYQQREGLEPEM